MRRPASMSCISSSSPSAARTSTSSARAFSRTCCKSFEVTPEITFLEHGTLGKEFEASIKAARFVDRRG